MKRSSLLKLAALGLALMAGSSLAAHRTVIFVWDGMRPDAISAENTPNLAALRDSGVNFTDNHSTYPTFTMINAASFATGSFPGTTGFFGNTLWAPGAGGKDSAGTAVDFQQPAFTEDYAILQDLNSFYNNQLLLVGTLFQAAQKAGLKTAAIGKSGPAFLQDYTKGGVILDEKHVEPARVAQGLQQAGYVLPKLSPLAFPDGSVTLADGNGDPTASLATVRLADGVTTDPTDAGGAPSSAANAYMMSAYLNYILPTEKPDLSLIWFRNPDSTEHAYGVGSKNFRDALRAQDQLLGQLELVLTARGELADTNIIVVSDHGHSNVSGDPSLFPLRAVAGGKTGDPDPQGYSASGDVRTADLMTKAGFKAFDGTGCVLDPVMSGLRADGTPVYPVQTDADGSVCGKAGALYNTPSYRVPATLAPDSFVIAANGGSDYLYNPAHDPALVAKAVAFLQSRPQYGAIFVDDRYQIPGTLPMSRVHLENTGRNPDIVVSFNFDPKATVLGFPGTEYESAQGNRGMHGSFSPVDVHNTLVASGPDFRTGYADPYPSGNVDLAPTVAQLFGLSLPQADGRPLIEALKGGEGAQITVQPQTVNPAQAADGLTMLSPADPSGQTTVSGNSFTFDLQTKVLSQGGQSYTYFDSATPVRK